MSEHRLEAGKELINGLADLGKVLGYYVEKEFPVDENRRGAPPAVDVAWFSEEGQLFPLFIFEVESTASNSIANNPLKVFAQETRRFEKPLFFFQIVSAHGEESSRIANLERQYGTYNYRIYRFGNDEGNALLSDVLRQHRRIRSDINYVELYHALSGHEWRGIVDPPRVLREAFIIGLSPNRRLASYIKLARSDDVLLQELKEVLKLERNQEWSSVGELSSYIGRSWGVPVLCSLMISLANNERDIIAWNSELLAWQKASAYMPMITASFGLSSDYDWFLLGVAAPLVALCCAVASENGTFPEHLCDVLLDILRKIRGSWYAMHTASWLCHIAARFGMIRHFKEAMMAINEQGGLQEKTLFCPPSFVSNEIGEDVAFPAGLKSLCPELEEFRSRAQRCIKTVVNPQQVALRSIDEDTYMYDWAEDIVAALWS